MKTKKLAACSSVGQLLLWHFLHRNLERYKFGGLPGGDWSVKLNRFAQGTSRRTCYEPVTRRLPAILQHTSLALWARYQ